MHTAAGLRFLSTLARLGDALPAYLESRPSGRADTPAREASLRERDAITPAPKAV
jgi:hypothetical protein